MLPQRTIRKVERKVFFGPSLQKAARREVDAPFPLDGPLSDVLSNEIPNWVPQETISLSNGAPS